MDSQGYISENLDKDIEREFQIRNCIDNKAFSTIGVMIALLTLLLAYIDIPALDGCNCIVYLIYIFLFLGIVVLFASIAKLFYAVQPMDYPKLDVTALVNAGISNETYEELLKAHNKKKINILDKYHDVNQAKSASFRLGLIMGIIGLFLIIIDVLIIKIF